MNRVALALLVSLAACGDGVPAPAAMDPVSAEEAATLAAAFEAAVEPCEPTKLAALFDSETIARRAVRASKVRKGDQEAAYQNMRREFRELGTMLCTSFGPEFSVELLGVRNRDGRPTPIFRGIIGTGFNYYELELGTSRTDHVTRIVDLYIYVTGERLSDTFAHLVADSVDAVRAGLDRDALKRITEARQRGDGAESRRMIAALPAKLRDSKQAQIMGLMTLRPTDAEYLPALARFERDFPDDPAVDIVSLDAHFLRRDLPATLKTIDRLEQRVGGDPYLSFLRGNAYLLEPTPEHLAAAEAAVRAAVAGLPHEQRLLIELATVQLRRRDRAGAVTTLETLRTTFGSSVDPVQVAKDPDWQAFLASPEYAAWSASFDTGSLRSPGSGHSAGPDR